MDQGRNKMSLGSITDFIDKEIFKPSLVLAIFAIVIVAFVMRSLRRKREIPVTSDDEIAALATASQLRIRGWELEKQGLYGQARDAFSSAVDACSGFKSTTSKRALANGLRGRAIVHDEMFNYGLAKRDLDKAFVLLDEPDLAACPGIERLRNMCLTVRGTNFLVQSSEHYNPVLALQAYEEAMSIGIRDQAGLVSAPNNVPQANRAGMLDPLISKSNIALALSHLERWDEAEPLWHDIIQNGAPKLAMNSHFNWASACKVRGDWQQAVTHWCDALILARDLSCMDHEARALASLANCTQLDSTLVDGPGAAARHRELLVVLQRMGFTCDKECSICYDDFDTHPQFISRLAPEAGLQTAVAPHVIAGCWHMYHVACIEKYYETQQAFASGARRTLCPLCGI
jgi:tetratricopeptide (TPR) repeat protein